MRILIDTNIIIGREDYKVIDWQLTGFHRIAQEHHIKLLIHPESLRDIEKDKNIERKKIIISKLKVYPQLEKPQDYRFDADYIQLFGETSRENDEIDAQILYALYKDAIDFFVTEDAKLIKRAARCGVKDRVFTIPEILNFLTREFETKEVSLPLEISNVPLHNLDITDEFFSELRKDYPEFDTWFQKIQREGRSGFVYFHKNKIKALLILKEENEGVNSQPPLPPGRRLKICTLKVLHRGYKIGEFFLKTAFQEAINKSIFEVYLTHFNEENDFLVNLIDDFGFIDVARYNNESLYLKKLIPPEKSAGLDDVLKNYYPSFYDHEEIGKYIVPIKPKFHSRLFPDADYNTQGILFSMHSINITEGNTIRKAYICHSKIKKINRYDLLFFYRSGDQKSITSFGIVENVYYDIDDPEQILKIVAKRTVYSLSEINLMTQNKKVLILIFRWYFHLNKPINLHNLMRHNILLAAPQSIMQINHEDYLKLKDVGELDERFIIN